MSIRHDVRTRMFLGGAWRDVTDKVLQRDPIEIERGRSEEDSAVNPQTCSLTLDNRTGEFSVRNPIGPWYGSLGRNVPIEVSYVLADDTFERTVSSGFGSADTGQTYSGNGFGGTVQASDFSVAFGVGRLSVPTTVAYRYVVLDGLSMRDVDVKTDVQISTTTVTGGQLEPGNIILRYQDSSNYYFVRVAIWTDQSVLIRLYKRSAGVDTALGSTVTTSIVSTGQTLSVRAQVEGQSFRAKVWDASDGEPLAWDVESHDETISASGAVGVRCGIGTGNTNPKPHVFSLHNLTVSSPRFAGEVSRFPTSSDVGNVDRYCTIEAAGVLRRLGQGKAPQRSSLRSGIPGLFAGDLVAYWPCEDGKNAVSVASAIPGYPAMSVVNGTPDFAEYDGFDSTEPLPVLRGSSWDGDVPGYALSGALELRFVLTIPSEGLPTNTRLIEAITTGSAYSISLEYGADVGAGEHANLQIRARDGSLLYNSSGGFEMDNQDMYWYIRLNQNGSNIDVTWGYLRYTGGAGEISESISSQTVGSVTKIRVNPDQSALLDEVTLGHIFVRNNGVALGSSFTVLWESYRGERALERIARLCEENGIPFSYEQSAGSDSTQLGTQRVDTLLNQIRDCALTDDGTLFESRGKLGLSYRTRRSLYTQPVSVTLDVANNDLAHPFAPVEDDTLTVNDVEAKNVNGTSARAQLLTGRLSVQDYPDGVGRYDSVFDVNVYQEASELNNHATWRLGKGTVDEARWPNVSVNLDSPQGQALMALLLDVDIDDRISIENTSEVGVYDNVSLLSRGTRESWSNHRATFSMTTAPNVPYAVAVIDAENRVDSTSSVTTSTVSSSATSFQVSSAAIDLWTVNASDFPLSISVGGEHMTVSAISGTSSPQTFTISARSLNGVVKAHTAGTEVHVLDVCYIGL